MSYHEWGDGFDFKGLNSAIRFIARLGKLVRLTVLMKEKYGTIRYEFTYLWKWSNNKIGYYLQRLGFNIVLVLACIRFYRFRHEILDDYLSSFEGVPWYFKAFIKENPWKRN